MEQNCKNAEDVIKQVGQVILGKDSEIKEVMLAFLTGGHILPEDIPGEGKLHWHCFFRSHVSKLQTDTVYTGCYAVGFDRLFHIPQRDRAVRVSAWSCVP